MTAADLNSVIFANDMFVATGPDGTLTSSASGEWSLATDFGFTSITWSPEASVYIGVGTYSFTGLYIRYVFLHCLRALYFLEFVCGVPTLSGWVHVVRT